jgi:hypothetical protein
MFRKPLFLVISSLAVALAACAPASATLTPQPPGSPTATISASESGADLGRTDTQGSVEFAVTPLNLGAPGATVDFQVAMNTHSVDVAWDLAAQSSLTTDTGLEVTGLGWPVGTGHHYEGTLTFPAKTADGRALLAGAKMLTLTIRNTDVAQRIFVWAVPQSR